MTEAEALIDIYDDSIVYDDIYRRYTDYEKSEYIRRQSNRFNKYDVGKYVVTKRPLFKKIVNILYLVDCSKTKLFWWSPDAKYAMVSNSKKAAEAQAAKYKYGEFKVIKIML